MTSFEHPGSGDQPDVTRVVGCDMAVSVSEPTEVVVQIAASRSAGQVDAAFRSSDRWRASALGD
jgi:hypothetical protein